MLPTTVVDLTAYLLVLTQARKIPHLREAATQDIHNLLDKKDAMIEQYGFPDDLRRRWEFEHRQVQIHP